MRLPRLKRKTSIGVVESPADDLPRSILELVNNAITHNVYHVGQIRLLRQLWASRAKVAFERAQAMSHMEELQAVKVSKKIEFFEYVTALSQEIGQEKALKILEDCVVNSALKWFEENKDKLEYGGSLLDQAFEIFYLKHLGLNPKDVQIVEKTANKLVCRWRNFCSVLEACKLLGLDTRTICKKAYEKPGRMLLKCIDPKLKFSRNYDKIRPYADYCEEIIELSEG